MPKPKGIPKPQPATPAPTAPIGEVLDEAIAKLLVEPTPAEATPAEATPEVTPEVTPPTSVPSVAYSPPLSDATLAEMAAGRETLARVYAERVQATSPNIPRDRDQSWVPGFQHTANKAA